MKYDLLLYKEDISIRAKVLVLAEKIGWRIMMDRLALFGAEKAAEQSVSGALLLQDISSPLLPSGYHPNNILKKNTKYLILKIQAYIFALL